MVLDYNQDTLQHTLSINFKFPFFKDEFEWEKIKMGLTSWINTEEENTKLQRGKIRWSTLTPYSIYSTVTDLARFLG